MNLLSFLQMPLSVLRPKGKQKKYDFSVKMLILWGHGTK